MSVHYRPPDSDSDSDYDGFYFGDYEEVRRPYYEHVANRESQMSIALSQGDLETVKNIMHELSWEINQQLDESHTLLQLAAVWGHLHIVQYLVEQCQANVDYSKTSLPPLLLVCQNIHQPAEKLVKIVQFLLEKGAKLQVTDQYQTTPLMFAAKQGHTHIMHYLLEQGVPIEARDCNGDTALYHAIEHNKSDALQLLLDMGAQSNIVNNKGYSPVQAAQFYGFIDLLNILPKPVQAYTVPVQFTSYNTLRDYIPQIFLRSDCPPYFQEVAAILSGGKKISYLKKFAQAGVSLETFLNVNDQRLIELGINLPVQRMVIKRILLRYFLCHWKLEKANKIRYENNIKENNFHNILMMTASHLRQLIVLKCTVRYIRSNMEQGLFGIVPIEQIADFQKCLKRYQCTIEDAQCHAAYLASFSPVRNPLYIDFEEFLARKQHKQKRRFATFKHTVLFVGISIIIYLRLRKLFK